MTKTKRHHKTKKTALDQLDSVKSEWGAPPDDNFGYTSEKERREMRGLEDWEMVNDMSNPQPGIFPWLHTVIGAVIAGVILFALLAYAIYYFLFHYGLSLYR